MKWMREVVVVAAVLIVAGGARGQAGTSAQGNQQTGQAPAPSVERSQRGNGKTPSHEVLLEAKKDCADLFGDLANGNTQEAARWMADEVGYTRDDDGKAAMRDDFKSKLDAVITSPPDSPYGKLSGFDLLDEAYLPNSARYFRLIYVSYHEGAPLVWQFRFYVKPDGHVALEAVEWSEKNPFEYMAAPEMLYPKVISEK